MDRFRRVLIAEDDSDDFQFFAEALENISTDFSITRVKNGLECVKILRTGEVPDVIFLDLNIPLKSGLECLTFIKGSAMLAEIPVIIYSTSHYIKHIDIAYKTGAHSYIVKPSNGGALVDRLKIVFERLQESLLPCKENFVIRNMDTKDYYK